MKKLLLHVCCAPCLTGAVLKLKEYEVTLFFSNSNILNQEEYLKRLQDVRRMSKIYGMQLIEDEYNHAAWLSAIAGLEKEPEKGLRCRACFRYNLKRTAQYAQKHHLLECATTLTISPHKDSKLIFKIGQDLGGFLAMDFKKQNGFKQSLELSKKYELYRQNFCGCEFALRK